MLTYIGPNTVGLCGNEFTLVCRLVYSTQILLVPANGADVNVSVEPDTVYADDGFWMTLSTATISCAGVTTGIGKVKAVVDPLPEKYWIVGEYC
jgi:hypothetical protein